MLDTYSFKLIFITYFHCRELLLLSMTVSMGMLIFAGLGYAVEKDEPDTMFYTLPQTLYWAIITMTSTGKSVLKHPIIQCQGFLSKGFY